MGILGTLIWKVFLGLGQSSRGRKMKCTTQALRKRLFLWVNFCILLLTFVEERFQRARSGEKTKEDIYCPAPCLEKGFPISSMVQPSSPA